MNHNPNPVPREGHARLEWLDGVEDAVTDDTVYGIERMVRLGRHPEAVTDMLAEH